MSKPGKYWLELEREIREVLGNPEIGPISKVVCIDEIMARYTKRGNEIPEEIFTKEREAVKYVYPQYFDWEN